jgi:NADPH:quinone reductase-like Zn-dependent oxidoreductase
MKAATRTQYGGPEVLIVKEIDKPVPKPNEVLIRVHATTVNRTDCGILWGTPYIIRLFSGLSKPKHLVPGTDFAGVVTEIGKAVKDFKIGDRVWGFDDSGVQSQGEFMAYPADKAIAGIPDNISFEQAAASGEAAHYAYNFINKVKMSSGHRVLVNGGTGAIGSAAIQLLKYYGAFVAATSTTKALEIVKSIGPDKVIDWQREDFTKDGEQYDYVFDAVGKSTFAKCKPLLKPKGVYLSSELGPGWQNLYLPLITTLLGGKKVKFPLPVDCRRSVLHIRKLLAEGRFKPVIEKSYPLDQIGDAYEYVNSGQKTGNVVISILS